MEIHTQKKATAERTEATKKIGYHSVYMQSCRVGKIQKFLNITRVVTFDGYYEARRKAKLDENYRLSVIEEQGLQQGLEQGELKKALETARNMIQEDFEISVITRITGLTETQLKEHGVIK